MSTQTSPVSVRLSPDALHLEVLLAPEARLAPPEAVAALIREASGRLGVELPLTVEDLRRRLHSTHYGCWFTLLSGSAPSPTVDGRVELLVPVPVAGRVASSTPWPWPIGVRQVVRAGALLARLRDGETGSAGFDLLNRPIHSRPPRTAHLPQGHNTAISHDGRELRATCDGEVVLRNLRLTVDPLYVHEGDLTAAESPMMMESGVFVTGSVLAARIVAAGSVHVQGDVQESFITSRNGTVSVAGSILGTERNRSSIESAGDISCTAMLHAELHIGGSVYLAAEARHSTLHMRGNLYLQQAVERSLLDVALHLGGGLIPIGEPVPQFVAVADRQHFRVPTHLDADVALHGDGVLRFSPCTILDLSTSGARCRLTGAVPSPGAIVQLKFQLPGDEDQILVIGRATRNVGPDTIGIAYVQMTKRDSNRLTDYCLRVLLARKHSKLATRGDRLSRSK